MINEKYLKDIFMGNEKLAESCLKYYKAIDTIAETLDIDSDEAQKIVDQYWKFDAIKTKEDADDALTALLMLTIFGGDK